MPVVILVLGVPLGFGTLRADSEGLWGSMVSQRKNNTRYKYTTVPPFVCVSKIRNPLSLPLAPSSR